MKGYMKTEKEEILWEEAVLTYVEGREDGGGR